MKYYRCSKCGGSYTKVKDEKDFRGMCMVPASYRISGFCGGGMDNEISEEEYNDFLLKQKKHIIELAIEKNELNKINLENIEQAKNAGELCFYLIRNEDYDKLALFGEILLDASEVMMYMFIFITKRIEIKSMTDIRKKIIDKLTIDNDKKDNSFK